MVHRLVHAAPLGDKPVIDTAERGEHAALDTGLLGDLTDRGLFGGLTELDVSLRQGPEHAPAPVDAADQGSHLGVIGPVDSIDDQPTRRCLVHGAKAIGWPAGPGLLRLAGSARLDRLIGYRGMAGVYLGGGFWRTCRATAAAPTPAPSWFGLFA